MVWISFDFSKCGLRHPLNFATNPTTVGWSQSPNSLSLSKLKVPMKSIRLILGCLLLFATSLSAEDKIRGNYDVLHSAPKKNSLDKVMFEEFFNFGCPHCNHFNQASKEFRKQFQGRIEFNDIPILFSGQNDAPLRLFYVAKKAGKGDEAKQALFDAKFKHGVNVFDPGIINYLSRTLGLGEAYQKEGTSEWVNAQLRIGDKKSKDYQVEATPTVVIAGALKMKIGANMEEFVKILPDTINDLLKKQ